MISFNSTNNIYAYDSTDMCLISIKAQDDNKTSTYPFNAESNPKSSQRKYRT